MKVITWTCSQCGARHKQTATSNENAVYGKDGPCIDHGNLLQVEPTCGACGYVPLIKKAGDDWEDVR